MDKKYYFTSTKGFTLPELLLVVALIGILTIIIFLNFPGQIDKGFDRRRKHDLTRIKTGFEEYYSDNGCYPSEDIMNLCGDDASQLQPYLSIIPCDPGTKLPYGIQVENTDCPQWFKIFANLQFEQDAIIAQLGCLSGCGPDEDADGTADFNYGVSSTNVSLVDTLTCESGYYYGVDAAGVCNLIANPSQPRPSCSPYFCESDCSSSTQQCL